MTMMFDEKLGIIRSTVKGVQTADQGIAYLDALSRHVAIARAHGRRVLHLVDACEAMVQPTATTDFYAASAAMTGGGVDRVAVILHSVLLKMQTQRAYADLPVAIFSDAETALAWLLAEAPAQAA